jgi:hypothetical protein
LQWTSPPAVLVPIHSLPFEIAACCIASEGLSVAVDCTEARTCRSHHTAEHVPAAVFVVLFRLLVVVLVALVLLLVAVVVVVVVVVVVLVVLVVVVKMVLLLVLLLVVAEAPAV